MSNVFSVLHMATRFSKVKVKNFYHYYQQSYQQKAILNPTEMFYIELLK